MHEVRERFGGQVCYYLSAWLGFDVVTPERQLEISQGHFYFSRLQLEAERKVLKDLLPASYALNPLYRNTNNLDECVGRLQLS